MNAVLLALLLAVPMTPLPATHVADHAEILGDSTTEISTLAQKHGYAVATYAELEKGDTPESVAKQLQAAWGVHAVMLIVGDPKAVFIQTDGSLRSDVVLKVASNAAINMRATPGPNVILALGDLSRAKEAADNAFWIAVVIVVVLVFLLVLIGGDVGFVGFIGGGDSGGDSGGGGSSY